MGVSLPKEHLEYFKRNMRIGLAHPRSSRGRRAEDVSQDSESEYEESDSESDLSDELAALDLDDIDWMNPSHSEGLKRSQTFSNGASSHRGNSQRGGLNRRAMRSGAGGRRFSTDQGHRDRSTIANEPIMQSLLQGGRRRSINEDATMAGSYGSLSTTPRPGMFQDQHAHAQTITEASETQSESGETDQEGTLKASDRARLLQMRAKREPTRSRSDESNRNASVSRRQRETETSSSSAEHSLERGTDRPLSTASNRVEVPYVSFNSLPNKAQYLILK